jgi:hypothetical protein
MKPKATMITGVMHCVSFQPAKHLQKKSWDDNDTDFVFWLFLALTTIGYFGYGLLT